MHLLAFSRKTRPNGSKATADRGEYIQHMQNDIVKPVTRACTRETTAHQTSSTQKAPKMSTGYGQRVSDAKVTVTLRIFVHLSASFGIFWHLFGREAAVSPLTHEGPRSGRSARRAAAALPLDTCVVALNPSSLVVQLPTKANKARLGMSAVRRPYL